MATDERVLVSPLEPGTFLLQADPKGHRPSMIYSILPAVVQNRIPTLPSIRRSIVDLRGRPQHNKSASVASDLSTPGTPPPIYTSRPGSSGSATPSQDSITSTDIEELYIRDDISERPGSSRSLAPPFPLSEADTGINWKYANQGINLLTQACQESNALARDSEDASILLTRQLYLHGMSYLLRAIPSDLTQEELLSLQVAIPSNVLNLQHDPHAHALILPKQQTELSHDLPPRNPSLLHRITATFVFQTFVLTQFLMPYIKLFIGHAYRWEREHKVTQRFVNKSIVTADEIGRKSLQLSHTICQMNDGKVGQAINDLTMWWVKGITGGLQQGISEGVVMIGNDRPQTPNGRCQKMD